MLVDVARVSGSVEAVAVLGDSIGVGIGDPAREGGWRGFAPLLAEALGAGLTNLAVSGSRIGGVRESQLPQALRARPDVARHGDHQPGVGAPAVRVLAGHHQDPLVAEGGVPAAQRVDDGPQPTGNRAVEVRELHDPHER